MPKRIFKIPSFKRGIVGNASMRDIPGDAMAYGENVDSRVQGRVQGIPDKTSVDLSFDGRVMAALLGDSNELIGQDSSKQFKSYDIDSDTTSNIGSATSNFAKTMVPHNRAVFCGMSDSFRGGSPTEPQWVGDVDHGQFGGSAPSGKVVTHAECKSYAEIQQYGSTSFSPYVQISNSNSPIVGQQGSASTYFLDSGSSSTFEASTFYFWAISLVYDGYQESPLIRGIYDSNGNLSYYFRDSDISGASSVSMLIGIGQNSSGDFSNRITHIKLYRSESTSTANPGTYRFIKSIDLDQSTGADFEEFVDMELDTSGSTGTGTTINTTAMDGTLQVRVDDVIKIEDEKMKVTAVDYINDTVTVTRGYESTSNVSHADGTDIYVAHNRIHSTSTSGSGVFAGGLFSSSNHFVRILDDGSTGAEYEDNTGVPSTLETTGVNYSIAEDYGSWMFVGDCSKDGIADAEKYIFRSKPKTYSIFDWSSDFIQLPESPTALAGFGGRLYAFSETNTYRINPDFMQVEDTFRGVGALNENMVVTTNYGMFHADDNNIYWNDGRTSEPIGTPILTNQVDSVGWAEIDKTSAGDEAYASMEFDPVNRRLLVFGTTSGSDLIVWAWDVERKRWDYYKTLGLVSTTQVGPSGTVYAVIGDTGSDLDLYSLFSSSTRTQWKVRTKDFDFDSDSGFVYLYDISAYGSGSLDIGYYVGGGSTDANPTVSTTNGLRQATVKAADKKSQSISVEVASAATTDSLDNLTVQYRLPVISE